MPKGQPLTPTERALRACAEALQRIARELRAGQRDAEKWRRSL